MRAVRAGSVVVGRLELSKPAGARPRSVAFPCASQVRGLLPARGEAALPMTLAEARSELVIAEGGRFCESSRWRGLIWEIAGMLPERPFVAGALPGRLLNAGELPGRSFVMGILCVGIFCCTVPR